MPDQPAGAPADVQVDGRTGGAGLAGAEPPAGDARSGGLMAFVTRLIGSRPVRWGFVLVTVGIGAWEIVSRWSGPHGLQASLSKLGAAAVIGALICVLAGLLALMPVYRGLLAALGSPLPARTAAQILFVGQLGKYLPGSVWPVLAQMELGAAHQVPRRRSATASVLTMLMSLMAGILVGLVALPFSHAAAHYRWVFWLAPVILICLYPRVLNQILDRLLRLARRPPLEQPLTGRAIGMALAWAVVTWVLFGLQIWLLAARMGLSGASGLLLAIGAFAFAWCAGFVVIFAPAGAGIRELVLILLLGPALGAGVIGHDKALAVAIVSRVLMTLGDLLSAGTAAWFARRSRHGTAGRPAP
jgi:glycosyltransferase 2 family protein